MRVVVCYPVEPRHIVELSAAAPGHEIINTGQEGVAREILDADIFLGHSHVPLSWNEVVRQGRLKWIQSSASGLDHCLVPAVVASDIVVTGASGLFADSVAEQTLALLCGLLRGLPTFFRAQQQHAFIRQPTRDLHGATVGIIGLGGNGRRLAQVLAPFRVTILATDMFPDDQPPEVSELHPATSLDGLLPRIDILILCLPLTDQTRGMIDARRLALLPPGSILINVARGPLVVERDLVAALKSGHLFGAGLDVMEVEPPPIDSPIWDLPNVLITPHVGAQSLRRRDVTVRFMAENLARYARGEPLKHVADKKLGFPRRGQ